MAASLSATGKTELLQLKKEAAESKGGDFDTATNTGKDLKEEMDEDFMLNMDTKEGNPEDKKAFEDRKKESLLEGPREGLRNKSRVPRLAGHTMQQLRMFKTDIDKYLQTATIGTDPKKPLDASVVLEVNYLQNLVNKVADLVEDRMRKDDSLVYDETVIVVKNELKQLRYLISGDKVKMLKPEWVAKVKTMKLYPLLEKTNDVIQDFTLESLITSTEEMPELRNRMINLKNQEAQDQAMQNTLPQIYGLRDLGCRAFEIIQQSVGEISEANYALKMKEVQNFTINYSNITTSGKMEAEVSRLEGMTDNVENVRIGLIQKDEDKYSELPKPPPKYWILRFALMNTAHPSYGSTNHLKLQNSIHVALTNAEQLKSEMTGKRASLEEKYQCLANSIRQCDRGLPKVKPGEILNTNGKMKKERCLVYFHTGKCKNGSTCSRFHVTKQHWEKTPMCHFDKACKKGLKCNYRHSDDHFAHAKNPTTNQAEEQEEDVEDEDEDDNNEDA